MEDRMHPAMEDPNLQDRLHQLLVQSQQGAVDFLIALTVLLAGWLIAVFVSRIVRAILHVAHFNDGIRRLFGTQAAGDHEPAELAAWGVYWLVLAWAGMLALESLGFELRTSLANRMLDVVPRIVAAAMLLVVGGAIALLVGRIATRFFEGGGLRAARLRGQAIAIIVFAFTSLLAMDQLGFAAQFVMAAGLIALGGAALAVGLSFGLGCRDLVREFVVEYLRSLEDKESTGIS
jgi:hypothetical protein